MIRDESLDDLINAVAVSGKDERIIAKTVTKVLAKLSIDGIDSINDLSKTINDNSEANNALSKKLLWLNIVLSIAAIIGVIFTVLSFCKNY